jgi:hypothetical protein
MSEAPALADALEALMTRLAGFSEFPKYSLERRIDILLEPFLEALVRARHPGAELVAPEFPILAELRTRGADLVLPEPEEEDSLRPKLSRRTVNGDYLFHLPGPEWLIVELKTDVGSFDTEQADLYAKARRRGMDRLREDLRFVRRKTRQGTKYDKLLGAMDGFGEGGSLRIAYLAPRKLLDDEAFVKHQKSEGAINVFFALEDLGQYAAEAEAPFPALWPFVKGLLDHVLKPPK